MKRAGFISSLVFCMILPAATGQAMRGGAMHGGGTRTNPAHGAGGRSGVPVNSRTRSFRSYRNGRNDNSGNNSLLYPAWYGEPYDGDEAAPADEFGPLVPPPMALPGKTRTRPTPAGPKITELPGGPVAVVSAPKPPAMFILTTGERIETRQYLVTYQQVQLTVDRQPRTIPFSMLDVNATLAADRERGIDLRLPAGQSEISLGF